MNSLSVPVPGTRSFINWYAFQGVAKNFRTGFLVLTNHINSNNVSEAHVVLDVERGLRVQIYSEFLSVSVSQKKIVVTELTIFSQTKFLLNST